MKRTRIAGGKGRSSSITTNKNMRGHLKRVGNGERWWWRGRDMVLCGRGREKVGRGEKSSGKGRGNMKRISGKLRGKNEIRTVHYLGRRYVGIFGRISAEAKEDPGKMVKPVRSGGTGTKGVF